MTKPQAQQLAAWIFGSLSFAFLIIVFFFAPVAIDEPRQRILGIMSALLAGLFGYFLVGSTKFVAEGRLPWFSKIVIQAGGGVALFLIVLYWWLSDKAPVKPLTESRKQILEVYNKQIMDNLARIYNGKPFIHFAYLDSTGNVAKPVLNEDVYLAYIDFLSVPNRFQCSEKSAPPPDAHVSFYQDNCYYWVPAEYRYDYLHLSIRTLGWEANFRTIPDSFKNSIVGVTEIRPLDDRHAEIVLAVRQKVPNDVGAIENLVLDGRLYRISTVADTTIKHGLMTDRIAMIYNADDLPYTLDALIPKLEGREVSIRLARFRPPVATLNETLAEFQLLQQQKRAPHP